MAKQQRVISQHIYSSSIRRSGIKNHVTRSKGQAEVRQWCSISAGHAAQGGLRIPGNSRSENSLPPTVWGENRGNGTGIWEAVTGFQKPNPTLGTSLAVQQLRLRLLMQGVQVWSLLWELRSHMFQSQKKKKKVKQKQYINACMWNLEQWYWWTYLQGSNETQTYRTDLWTQAGKERVGQIESRARKHTHYHVWNR